MKHYESTAIPDYLSVRSIVAVLSRLFRSSTAPPKAEEGEGERHDFPELFYVREGEAVMIVGGTPYALSSGQMMIYAPLDPHKGGGARSAEVSILSFKADFGRLPKIYNRVITLSSEQIKMLEEIIDEGVLCYEKRAPGSDVGGMILREGVSEYSIQKLKRNLELFLIDIYRSEGLLAELSEGGRRASRKEQFYNTVDMLRHRLGEELTVGEIARSASMSVSKLKLLFREYAKTGPINFFIDMKIERAKELIDLGEQNFTEIAEMLGFASLHYFSRLFKSRVGQSPSEWSKRER